MPPAASHASHPTVPRRALALLVILTLAVIWVAKVSEEKPKLLRA